MRIWGKPFKAGKEARPEPVPAGAAGPQYSGSNALPGPGVVYGVNPVSAQQAGILHMATSLVSPMAMGRFEQGDQGDAAHRGLHGATPDLGALQVFKGLYPTNPLARLGAQAGPSSQPGFPATNNTVLAALAAQDLPDIMRVKGL